MALKYSGISPYNFAFNNPVSINDPSGADPYGDRLEGADDYLMYDSYAQNWVSWAGELSDVFKSITPGSGNHWSDEFRSPEANMEMMSTNTFRNHYGLRDKYGNINITRTFQMAQYFRSQQSISDRMANAESIGLTYKDKYSWAGSLSMPYTEAALNGTVLANLDISYRETGSWMGFNGFGELYVDPFDLYNGGVIYDGDAFYGTNFIGPGPTKDPYKLDPNKTGRYLKPKDMMDAAAQRHDYYYYMNRADGLTGALFNTDVTFADRILVGEAYNAFTGYYKGEIDPITLNPISPRTRDFAVDVMSAFGIILLYKK